jgi:signal transduction histidine kinase
MLESLVPSDPDAPHSKASELARSLSDPAFLKALSHDLRGPLGAIGTWIHVLRSGRADAATQEQALSAIQRDVGAQSRLLDQLDDLSSILGGTSRPSVEEVDLVSLLKELGAELQGRVSPPPTVLADPRRLRQIFTILLPGDAAPGAPSPVLIADDASPATLAIRGSARRGMPSPVGLTLARALVELQGGHLTTSPTPEKTSFEIQLPTLPGGRRP